MRRGMLKSSLRRQLAAITIGLLVGTILACWFINNTFLESYYEREKADVVQAAYQRLNEAAVSDRLGSEDFAQEMGRYAFASNINVEVIDVNSRIVYAAVFNNGEELSKRLLWYIIGYPWTVPLGRNFQRACLRPTQCLNMWTGEPPRNI